MFAVTYPNHQPAGQRRRQENLAIAYGLHLLPRQSNSYPSDCITTRFQEVVIILIY